MPVRQLSLQELAAMRDAYDDAVAETAEIDRFCTASAWMLAARRAFHRRAKPRVLALDDGYAAFLENHWPSWGPVLTPFEASWCLACPVVGRAPAPVMDALCSTLQAGAWSWQALLLAGLVPEGVLWRTAVARLSPRFRLYRGPSVTRRIAALDGGFDGFLARRSAKFRGTMRRNVRRGEEAGLSYEYHAGALSGPARRRLFLKMMAIEARGWKGLTDQGVNRGPMRVFYRELLALLGPAGAQRILFLRRGEELVGYLFGAVWRGLFRGFQFSFAAEHAALSPGNLMQWHLIGRLCEEGVDRYDLGTDIDYKRRWGESAFTTAAIVVRP